MKINLSQFIHFRFRRMSLTKFIEIMAKYRKKGPFSGGIGPKKAIFSLFIHFYRPSSKLNERRENRGDFIETGLICVVSI